VLPFFLAGLGRPKGLVATGGPKFSPPANPKTEQQAIDWFWSLGENFAKI
jgi:hypothetical protein